MSNTHEELWLATEFEPLDPDPARSPTLPGHFYSSPAVFEAERERIFYRSWQLIAHRSQLAEAGSFVCAHIIDQHVFVIRGRDGKLRAFYNVCSHRAHELLEGSGSLKSLIICPYHAWTYETDGSLRVARHADHLPDFEKEVYGLKPVCVEEILGFVFVNLDPEAQTLESLVGDMFEDIRQQVPWWHELEISNESKAPGWSDSALNANWKVLAENCLECYHCGPAHPAFVDLVAMDSFSCEIHGSWLRSFGKLNKPDNKAYPVEPSEPSQAAIFWHLWPNVEISVFPGEASLSAFRFYPVQSEVTRMTSIFLRRPGESAPPERSDYRWNVLWPEDRVICESVHRGLKSRGYNQGRFVIDPEAGAASEHAVHYFQTRYVGAMGL